MSSTPQLFVHVGLPKTGTTYLQSIFFASQAALANQGLAMLPNTRGDAFRLMLALRGRLAEFDRVRGEEVLDRWQADLAQSSLPAALFTEESLSRALPKHIAALLERAADHEVHLIVTFRDLGRQLPSAWQQHVKAGGTQRFDEYVTSALRDGPDSGKLFWSAQDLAAILRRWAPAVPAERTHLVIVGRSGDPTRLLRDYSSVLGVDPGALDVSQVRSNSSLGLAQAELLAEVNRRLAPGTTSRASWGAIGKTGFAERVLAGQPAVPARLGPQHRERCIELAALLRAELIQRPYDVVGDLDDVLPAPDTFLDEPATVDDAELLETALDALAGVLERDTRRHRSAKRRAAPQTAVEPPRRRWPWSRPRV